MPLWIIAVCAVIYVILWAAANSTDLYSRITVGKELLIKMNKMEDDQKTKEAEIKEDKKFANAMKRVDRLNRTAELYKLMGMNNESDGCLQESQKILDEVVALIDKEP